MNPKCQAQRDVMVEHVLGELDGLVAARLEAHLANCEACARVHARLAEGFQGARTLEPEVSESELSRMASRLAPYMEPAHRSRPGFGWVVGAAAAFAGVVAVWSAARPDVEPQPPAPLAAITAPVPAPAPPPAQPVRHRALTPHLKAVVSGDWAGAVRQPAAERTALEMDAGFAVLDFEGGEGRTLQIVAPDVEVVVLGTRLFVEAHAGVPTTVGVVSGKVEVRSHGQIEILGPGQVRAFDAAGAYTPDRANLRSVAHHDDGFLDRAPAPEAPVAARRVAPKPRRARPEPVAALTSAERLVRQGKVAEGLKQYEALIASRPPAPWMDVARYERARVWGFVQGDLRRADAELARLAAGADPEVRHQARLARCELAFVEDRCAAAECLEALARDPAVAREAAALMARWGVRGDTSCGQ
ncbi:MAG: zf-HC2 domain-containing protein [Deltaproteobacteria bacterium]|nr:zf-HC2 domain-containing protein [Deltaproteobacteria bacterium]